MGKQIKRKQQEAEANEMAFRQRFALLSNEAQAKASAPPPPLLDELEGYLDRVIRDPEGFVPRTKTENRTKQLQLLVRHAFVAFRPPAILDQAWVARHGGHRNLNLREARRDADIRGRQNAGNINCQQIDFKDWYIAAAAGKSLYKTCTRGLMTKAETHFFATCPHQTTLPETLYYAVARAAGATDGRALRLARSKLSEKPFKEEFWRDCARFFAAADNHPTSVDQMNDLVDFLAAKHAESHDWRLFGGGHTLGSLLRKMKDWHHALRRLKELGTAQWDGHALNDHTLEYKVDGKTWFWDFKQIKNTKDLAAEGTAMRHCVLSYKHGCMSGNCSIWSLRLRDPYGDSKRRLTIEVRDDGRIVQKRGLANRSPRPEEQHAVSLWARAAGLSDGYGY